MNFVSKMMLVLILALSVNVARAEKILGAPFAFKSVLPLGTYTGLSDINEVCKVEVFSDSIVDVNIKITYPEKNLVIRYYLNNQSDYYFNEQKKEFIQTLKTVVDPTSNVYLTNIVRTTLANENDLYIEVYKSLVFNTYTEEFKLNCLVKN